MNQDAEVVLIEEAMSVLSRALDRAMLEVEPRVRDRYDNALLNVAVNRLIDTEGDDRTAGILWRLADALSSGSKPTANCPIDLSALHG